MQNDKIEYNQVKFTWFYQIIIMCKNHLRFSWFCQLDFTWYFWFGIYLKYSVAASHSLLIN